MFKSFGACLALVFLSTTASAQMSAEVTFPKGNFGTMISGTIRGDEYFDYRLGARAGQQLFAELKVDGTNGHGTIYFNVLPPGSDNVAVYNGSIDGPSALITLRETGTYTIRVYLMGNDRDTGKTVGYLIDVSIQ
ncbi:hypothetical protein ATO6_19425 [Oceanicola sp. 22II-s10i]|uniref:hypothetical protein n=1 Tax=Oceanicola sp. 22II-s10i TaxID=1317116 RepID=UPI000B5282ED|nr:hypothetical protein [Oceanicola sp. 22II-s10i]OWU83306.1 hypothetical protein ATO6_19425 [Oceanicola sp. 22II-s10i]